jgi:hypothetical protein
MIREKLGDLPTHLRVFAPLDSRNAGRRAVSEPTDEEIGAAEQLGYRHLKRPDGRSLFVNGSIDLGRHWIALVPSRRPAERERRALEAVAGELAHQTREIPVALLHNGRESEEIARVFADAGIDVFLLVPFGVLTRRPLARITRDRRPGAIAIVSLASPNLGWSRARVGEAMDLLRHSASAVLISDPDPGWAVKRSNVWHQHSIAYLRYDGLTDKLRDLLMKIGAQAVGRRGDDGAPNLEMLLSAWRRDESPLGDPGAELAPKDELVTAWDRRSADAASTIRTPSLGAGRSGNKVTQSGTPARRLVFISHANPEDNPAAAWFATQLTLLGYEVWCDLKNAHGGESDFWLKVQSAIENEAAKFIYILSNASCDFERKKGIYKELQTADNLRINNFTIPIRIGRLTRPLPILINTSIYIDAENWAVGLRELVERLVEDGVPKRADIDFERIAAWWPAASVEEIVCSDEPDDLVSNILDIKALPENIHFLKVFSEGNLLAGFERLRSALPSHPSFYAHGDHAVSFASQFDLADLTSGLEFETAYVVKTRDFLASGHKESGVAPEVARNVTTFLVGQAWDALLQSKHLSPKSTSRSGRSIWYPREGLLPNNRASINEPRKRKVSIQLVGTIKHFRQTYRWHFGVYPTVDLRVHNGIILSPKAVISLPPRRSERELGAGLDDARSAPFLVDHKKVLKGLDWWNKEWRQRLLAMISWLSDGQSEIVIPVGCQLIIVSSEPQNYKAEKSYLEIPDDTVINRSLGVMIGHAPSP